MGEDDWFDDAFFSGGSQESVIMVCFREYHLKILKTPSVVERRQKVCEVLKSDFIENPDVGDENLKRCSSGAHAICVWVKAVYQVLKAMDVEMAELYGGKADGDSAADGETNVGYTTLEEWCHRNGLSSTPLGARIDSEVEASDGVLTPLGSSEQKATAIAAYMEACEVLGNTKKRDFDEMKSMARFPAPIARTRAALAVLVNAAGQRA
ncbi:unnamed protein product [Prorocentrum cordatum]|uniref:Uncharacterized protein n=1 Tax=Prorocentrum cordatum TaxID=2364126 RepID=A0ABN9S207_9DINO|nr:unnamed protein product [Polarella glacialis]|mmetsp:Transcript_86280/g.233916  ORF Transcript_86280/g.233916 Transcript_86280/m.233916 type:complete len:209 (+) Transcript_86280:219-845(+)